MYGTFQYHHARLAVSLTLYKLAGEKPTLTAWKALGLMQFKL